MVLKDFTDTNLVLLLITSFMLAKSIKWQILYIYHDRPKKKFLMIFIETTIVQLGNEIKITTLDLILSSLSPILLIIVYVLDWTILRLITFSLIADFIATGC